MKTKQYSFRRVLTKKRTWVKSLCEISFPQRSHIFRSFGALANCFLTLKSGFERIEHIHNHFQQFSVHSAHFFACCSFFSKIFRSMHYQYAIFWNWYVSAFESQIMRFKRKVGSNSHFFCYFWHFSVKSLFFWTFERTLGHQ